MISPLKELLEQIQQHFPKEEFISRQDLKRLIESAASRLDLVSRDQFDAQTAVLQRTRERLEVLEAKLAEIEKNRL
jgi:ubiquinone biosynthesis accessory factor UbiK